MEFIDVELAGGTKLTAPVEKVAAGAPVKKTGPRDGEGHCGWPR